MKIIPPAHKIREVSLPNLRGKMKTAPFLLLILSALLISSCASTKLIAPDLEVIYTKNKKNTGGIVVYNPHGISLLVNSRKSAAMARMRKACSPAPYEIIKEELKKVSELNQKYKGAPELIAGRTVKRLEYKCIQ